MKRLLGIGLALVLSAVSACRQAASEPEKYEIVVWPTTTRQGVSWHDVSPVPVVAGQVNKVEVGVHYQRNFRTAAKLKFKVDLSGPADWKVTNVFGDTSWQWEADLTTADAGYSPSRTILVEVPTNAASREYEVTITVIPESGEPLPRIVKFKI